MPSALQPTNRFVGMFDIVGFKALREQRGTMGVHQQFRRGILPAIQHSAAGKGKTEIIDGKQVYVPDFADSAVAYRAISDTVIFFTPDDSFDAFACLINSAFMLLQFGFGGGKAPYRGAIGWGDLINDPDGILLGSAIEDAYSGESSQAWAGAMLTAACRDFANGNNFINLLETACPEACLNASDETGKRAATENTKRLVRYRVPIQQNPKDGPATYADMDTYVIDWTIRMYDGAAEKSFAPSSSKHAQTIAANTRAFEVWARANNR